MEKTEQQTVSVKYKCKKGHINAFTFGEEPPHGVDPWTVFKRIETTSYYKNAIETLSAYCDQCDATVPMNRVGPQPK